jgi:hypothetical protein
MKYLNCLVLLTLISCGSGELKKDLDHTTTYRTSGVEQFFLAELPSWANFSSSGSCFKESSFHYMDFSKLKEAYQLSYLEMIELQAQFNERLETYFRSAAVRFIKPVEEASFFSNTLEQVRGGVRSLKLPNVKEVEVIWFEGLAPDELKKMAQSDRFNEKLPVLFSSCHSHQGLTQWLMQEKLDNVGFRLITAEWLNPFSSEGKLTAGLHLELGQLFGKEIKVSLFKSNNHTTTELLLP